MLHRLSVVIPVHNSATELRQCLEALGSSQLPPFECIVVDDGSTDASAEVAAEVAARHGARVFARVLTRVLTTGHRAGPARARNVGAQAASGEIILFLDADVTVHPGTTAAIVAEFEGDAGLDALMGSYDDSPSAQNFVSQYRNLMHCFVHQNSSRAATTFWAGCGAIRRQVFLDSGGFDEKYSSPAIEDIELGYRLHRAGRKLILCADIRVKHLKRWGLRSMIETDFFHRALPWSTLTLESGRMPNDLNLRIGQRISVGLVFILIALGAWSTLRWRAFFLTPLLTTFFVFLSYYWIENLANRSRLVTVLMALYLALILGFSSWFQMYAIIPMVLIACIALLARRRYAYSSEVWRRRTGVLVGGYCLLVAGLVWVYFPWTPVGSVFLLLLLTLLLLNMRFYLFLAGNRGKLFALAAIPFHLLYFTSSGLAFIFAAIRHGLGKLGKSSRGDNTGA